MRPAVLAYHAVGDCAVEDDPYNLWMPTQAFERQVAYLSSRRQVVPLSDVVAGRAPARSVAITFDDGYRSVLENAVPILRAYRVPATVFVPTAHVGDRNRWDAPSGPPLDIMTETELAQAEKAGVTIESHGHRHVDLSGASNEDARRDLVVAVERFHAILGRAPEFLAFPFGYGSVAAQAVAKAVGFRAAFTVDRRHAGPFAWSRVGVTRRDSEALFRAKCSPMYVPVRRGRPVEGVLPVVRSAARVIRGRRRG